MLDYVRCIFLPFLEAAKKPHNQPALALFDNFRGQLTGQFLHLLAANNVIIVEVPPRLIVAIGFECQQGHQGLPQKQISIMVC